LGLLEQRHKAVLEVLNGATVTGVARRYSVARQTLHDWLRRYEKHDRRPLGPKRDRGGARQWPLGPMPVEEKATSSKRA
jgi:transposase-like protein